MGWTALSWAGMGYFGLGWAGLGWAGLGWAGLGWAGLGWAGLGECVLPPQQRRGVHFTPFITLSFTLAGRRGGWGVNLLEDARHRIRLLQ
jgi:hypothetical protein